MSLPETRQHQVAIARKKVKVANKAHFRIVTKVCPPESVSFSKSRVILDSDKETCLVHAYSELK